MTILRSIIVAAGCIAVLLSGVSYSIAADEGVVNFSGKDPSEDDIVDALLPKAGKTRGIAPGAMSAGAAAAAPSVAKASFDQITFELNSDRILPKARGILDKIGRALNADELSDVDFMIEGHTDISGSMDYNMRLSNRRAESVKRYLVDNFHIEAGRLKTVGKGPTDLLDKQDPRSGSNRRVVFAAKEQGSK